MVLGKGPGSVTDSTVFFSFWSSPFLFLQSLAAQLRQVTTGIVEESSQTGLEPVHGGDLVSDQRRGRAQMQPDKTLAVLPFWSPSKPSILYSDRY